MPVIVGNLEDLLNGLSFWKEDTHGDTDSFTVVLKSSNKRIILSDLCHVRYGYRPGSKADPALRFATGQKILVRHTDWDKWTEDTYLSFESGRWDCFACVGGNWEHAKNESDTEYYHC